MLWPGGCARGADGKPGRSAFPRVRWAREAAGRLARRWRGTSKGWETVPDVIVRRIAIWHFYACLLKLAPVALCFIASMACTPGILPAAKRIAWLVIMHGVPKGVFKLPLLLSSSRISASVHQGFHKELAFSGVHHAAFVLSMNAALQWTPSEHKGIPDTSCSSSQVTFGITELCSLHHLPKTPGMPRGEHGRDVLNKQKPVLQSHVPSAFCINPCTTDSMSKTSFLQQTALAIAFIAASQPAVQVQNPLLLKLWHPCSYTKREPLLAPAAHPGITNQQCNVMC